MLRLENAVFAQVVKFFISHKESVNTTKTHTTFMETIHEMLVSQKGFIHEQKHGN